MKIKINKEVIISLNPCQSGLQNYIEHYADFNGDILEFLALAKITSSDKVWVAIRVMPRFLVEVFAIDCALAANASALAAAAAYAAADAAAGAAYAAADAAAGAAYAAADAAAGAAYDAAYAAADAAVYAAAYAAADAAAGAERERQLDAIAYLVKGFEAEVEK